MKGCARVYKLRLEEERETMSSGAVGSKERPWVFWGLCEFKDMLGAKPIGFTTSCCPSKGHHGPSPYLSSPSQKKKYKCTYSQLSNSSKWGCFHPVFIVPSFLLIIYYTPFLGSHSLLQNEKK